MDFSTINWLAVVIATVASWALGAVWYMVLADQWLASIGKTQEQLNSRDPTPYIWSVVVQLVMAIGLAALTPKIFGATNIVTGLQAGFVLWLGFVITSMIQNHPLPGGEMEPHAHRWRLSARRAAGAGARHRVLRLS